MLNASDNPSSFTSLSTSAKTTPGILYYMKLLYIDFQKTITCLRYLRISIFSTFRSSRLAGRGPGLTGVMLDALQ